MANPSLHRQPTALNAQIYVLLYDLYFHRYYRITIISVRILIHRLSSLEIDKASFHFVVGFHVAGPTRLDPSLEANPRVVDSPVQANKLKSSIREHKAEHFGRSSGEDDLSSTPKTKIILWIVV